MFRNRHIRFTYSGRQIARRPFFPRLLQRGREVGPSRGNRFLRQFLLALLGLGVASFSVTLTGAYLAYAHFTALLQPRVLAVQERKPFLTSHIFDRHGTLLYEFFDAGKRTKVALKEISPLLIKATIAIEDQTFFTNSGVDFSGIAKALYRNYSAGEEASGASTITQQVVKNIILTEEERSYENRYQRKLKEILMAQELNNSYTKQDILGIYLNEIYYGNLTYGIEAACDVYFKTHAKDINLAQAALLAGLPQRPSKYDPLLFAQRDDRGPFLSGLRLEPNWLDPNYQLSEGIEVPKWRQISVLRQMVNVGYIQKEEAEAAAAEELRFAPQEIPLNAPHFVFYVRNLLEEKYGQQLVRSGGINIYTTLDLGLQSVVQAEATKHIQDLNARNIHNAAVVVMQPRTGQILAMVGSIDYNAVTVTKTPGQEGNVLDGQVNVAIRERQPGSALKPFTYLAAMEKGLTPASVLWDVPIEFPMTKSEWYKPENYDGKWHGPLRIRTALANSLNMPAIKALKFAGIDYTLNLLKRVGIKSGLQREANYYGLSLTLGGGEVTLLELTTAYNTLANGGRYVPPTPILKITDSEGNLLENYEPSAGQEVVDPGMVSIISNMLSDDQARKPIWGLNSPLKVSRPAAVKTGTSNDWRDAWTLGYAPYITVGVWSGNNNNEPTSKVESLQGGGIIWHNVMEEVFRRTNPQDAAFNPELNDLLSSPFPEKKMPLDFSLPNDNSVQPMPICSLPGPFGSYDKELFTWEMLFGTKNMTVTQSLKQVRIPCDVYKKFTVVNTGNPKQPYCLPTNSKYSPDVLRTLYVWNFPPPDPDERVKYQWNSEGEGAMTTDNRMVSSGNFQTCNPWMFQAPDTPVQPVNPVQPAKPAQPAQPFKPGVPQQPVKPAVAQPARPAVVQPARPAAPAVSKPKPVVPVAPSKPVAEPPKPVAPAQPAAPQPAPAPKKVPPQSRPMPTPVPLRAPPKAPPNQGPKLQP